MKAKNDLRPLKTTAALVIFGYCGILLYSNREKYNQNSTLFKQSNNQTPTSEINNSTIKSVTQTETSTTKVDLSFVNITLDDILITVKTTQNHKYSRIPIVLKTWFQLAKNQTWFFTDKDDEDLQRQTNGHMINTNCPSSHDQEDLCCKTGAEYNFYYNTSKKWLCHFDDDNYVNVPLLVQVLKKCNYKNDWYFGKNSMHMPLKATFERKRGYHRTRFMFGTGGAGYCISRGLAEKMLRLASGKNFITQCLVAHSPDDITMGFIISARLGVKLTILDELHSHIETLSQIPMESLKNQISLSYGPLIYNQTRNVINITGFDTEYDPTRFLSLHCLLFPETDFCQNLHTEP